MFPTLVTEFLLDSLDIDIVMVCKLVCQEWYDIAMKRGISMEVGKKFWKLLFQSGDVEAIKFSLTIFNAINRFSFAQTVKYSNCPEISIWIYNHMDDQLDIDDNMLCELISNAMYQQNVKFLYWMSSSDFHVELFDFFEEDPPNDFETESLESDNLEIMKWMKAYSDDSEYGWFNILKTMKRCNPEVISWIIENFSYNRLNRYLINCSEHIIKMNSLVTKLMERLDSELFAKVCNFLQVKSVEELNLLALHCLLRKYTSV